MFNTITSQIKKLDKDLDVCKERLFVLKKSHVKNISAPLTKPKKLKRSQSVMNRKKILADKDSVTPCKKFDKVRKKLSDHCKTCKVIVDPPCQKKKNCKVKRRSRSVSCGRDCVSENNFHHNDLAPSKMDDQTSHKNSWANILKEHNIHGSKKSSVNSKPHSENNMCVFNPTSVYLKNRGVQCSESSFVPPKTNFSSDTGFTPYNPTRTLQFFMSEIRENLKHKREDKVLSIINDMEETIYRLKLGNEYPSYESRLNSNLNYKPPLNNNFYPNQDMNKIFEEGFSKLETSCKTLEVTCARLKEENKQLQLELQKKNANIYSLEKKEKDNLDKIELLNKHILIISQKGSQYTESIQDLTKMLAKLQQENKCIEPMKDKNILLEAKIDQLNKEKDGCFYDNQLLKLENEKLRVLLEIKEKQLNNYKDVFFGLEDKVKKEVTVMQSRCVSEDSDPDTSAPLCSSPNTSGSIMAPAYGSWRGVSRVSSNAESNCPPSKQRAEFHVEPSDDLMNRLYGKATQQQKIFKDSLGPRNEPIRLPTDPEHLNSKHPLDGIEGLRGQIKKLFSEHITPNKLSLSNKQNAQPLWTNLNSIQSSPTSYNTTS